MISVLFPSAPGVTIGIRNMIRAMQDNADCLLVIHKISKTIAAEDYTQYFSWVAIFRERGTVGQIVALVNQWGTTFGPRAGSTGSTGYCEMMSYIEDQEVEVYERAWLEIDPKLREQLEAPLMHQRSRGWERFILEYIDLGVVLPGVDYPINQYWQHRLDNMRGI